MGSLISRMDAVIYAIGAFAGSLVVSAFLAMAYYECSVFSSDLPARCYRGHDVAFAVPAIGAPLLAMGLGVAAVGTRRRGWAIAAYGALLAELAFAAWFVVHG